MYALSLRNTGYTFGGKNPEAGLDCSGMVAYTYQQAIGKRLSGNAAALAKLGREVARHDLRAGDLVFFNTSGRPFSHVGIFIGGDEFIHAPSTRGRVRVDKLSNSYYASRYETARTMLDGQGNDSQHAVRRD
jgi:cell wall-associated NlpC family hydrolase